MHDPYGYDSGYDPQQTTEFDPTAMDNMFPPPTQDYPNQYPNQTPYEPATGPAPRNPLVDQPTIMSPPPRGRYVVPSPATVRSNGEGAARMSLILGIISLLIGVLPVCGIVALLPAAGGILFGWIGLKSRRRNMALLGMLLSMLAIAAAFALVA